METQEHQRECESTRSGTRVTRSGVRFELRGDLGGLTTAEPSGEDLAAATFASASVVVERSGGFEANRIVRATRDGEHIDLESGGASIHGTLREGRFEGKAVLAVDHPRPLEALVVSVSTALAESLGGAAFHAATAVVDGRAIVYIGPSGAGKSTACRLTERASELSADRVLLVPSAFGLVAYRLAGGEPSGLAIADDGVPVAAILRVRRDATKVGDYPVAQSLAIADLCAAMLAAEGTSPGEALDRAASIAARTRVASIYTRLDHPIDPGSLR